MDTLSLWEAISKDSATYPELNKEIEVDVAIIGGGITGVTAALQLHAAGKKIAIIEANKIGSGTTGFSTGNLYVSVQPFYQHIASKFNEETAKIIAHSRKDAIDFIEGVIEQKKIACHFSRRPWYILTDNESKISFLEKEVDLLKKLDISINYTKELPLGFKFKKAAIMENQARLNPLNYVRGVAEDLQKQGCLLFENSRVLELDEKEVCHLKTAKGKIIAKSVIIATHTPIGINLAQMYTAPYRSYVVAVRLKDNIYPEGHFLDLDAEAYHSSCTHPIKTTHPELVLTAGSHHKTGQSKNALAHFKEIESYMRKHFPVADIAYQWSAQHYHSADDIPYIGLASRFAKKTYLATGFFADGLIYGTIAGKIISDLILENENHLVDTYKSNRFTPIASGAFLAKENIDVFIQYLKDFPFKESDSYSDIKIGQGRVVEINKEKCGVSRDKNNNLHIVSAVCTHMKCIVAWNNAEQTWDCPCHGSRFSREGQVIEGPALVDLEKKIYNT